MSERAIPLRAWVLPSGGNRAYLHCLRWHKRWRNGWDTPHGRQIDCSRCGLRWVS